MRQLAKQVVVALFFVFVTTMSAEAQVVHIGVDLPVFPRLVVVPGYPVYYAPAVRANYFFYDGLFWVFHVEDGYWYSSSWYNGPWVVVEPEFVPQPILVIPYRYYRVRPRYWGGWAFDRPPRWDVYWGPRWEARRRGWDHWDRRHSIAAAPLPLFQRQYERSRYPSPAQQVTIYNEHYHYRPQDVHVRDRQTTIIERQSRGGERARGRADWIEQRNQRQDTARRQETVQPRERTQRQSNLSRQENVQRQSSLRTEDRAQRRENVRTEDREQRQGNLRPQEKGRRQENLNAQDRARRRENVHTEDRAQRQGNLNAQEKGRRQENLQAQQRAQRHENVPAQEKGKRERKLPPSEKGQFEKGQG